MAMARIRWAARQALLGLALTFAGAQAARAGDPGPAGDEPARARAVRKVGGERGPRVEATRAGTDPAAQRAAELDALRSRTAEARERLKLAREQLREQARESRERVHEQLGEAPGEARAERSAKAATLAGEPAGRAARAQQARRAQWRLLASQFGRPSQIPAEVRAELARHARRTARLQRIRELAAQSGEAELVARADALAQRERLRHQKELAEQLRAQARAEAEQARAADDEPEEFDPEEVEEDEEGAEP